MRNRNPQDRRCSYVVLVDSATRSGDELRELAGYLSAMNVAGCDVVVLDSAPRDEFEAADQILRWVARHVAIRPDHRAPGGSIDIVRAATSLAACEKVIVADEDVRYTAAAIAQMCELLEAHEVAEPQDYVDPLPWWGGIEAGRILVHRGIEPAPDHGATFAFRRSAVQAMRSLGAGEVLDDQARRLAAAGADVHVASNVFVRREPGLLREWIAERPRAAGEDFAVPVKTALFLAIIPLLLVLSLLGGLRMGAGYAGAIAFASVSLALRGRSGASSFFPLRACLFAPLWVFERSFSVYWALLRKLSGAGVAPARVAAPDSTRERIASGG